MYYQQQHIRAAPPTYAFPWDPSSPGYISHQLSQDKYNKKACILDDFIKENDNNKTKTKLQLKPGDQINYYSSSLKQWIPNAKIITTTIDDDGTKRVNIKYKFKHIVGLVQRRAESKSIKLLHDTQTPHLIIITTKSHGKAYELLKCLKSISPQHENIKMYESENGQICKQLMHQINSYKVNIIVLPHYKRWIVPYQLVNRVDVIFKHPDNVHKSLYSDYNKLLKKTGKLIKIKSLFLKHEFGIHLLKDFINIKHKYIEILLKIWNKSMKLNIPSDIVHLIKQITGNILIDEFSKEQIQNY